MAGRLEVLGMPSTEICDCCSAWEDSVEEGNAGVYADLGSAFTYNLFVEVFISGESFGRKQDHASTILAHLDPKSAEYGKITKQVSVILMSVLIEAQGGG